MKKSAQKISISEFFQWLKAVQPKLDGTETAEEIDQFFYLETGAVIFRQFLKERGRGNDQH